MNWEKKCAAYLKALCFTLPEAGDLGPELKLTAFPDLEEIVSAARTAEVPPEAVEEHLSFRSRPILIHPLSGSLFPDFPQEIDWDKAGENLREAVKTMYTSCAGDFKKFFIELWRRLPHELQDVDTSGLGALWHLVPGHFAMPFHTIWQWASICSTFAAAWPNPTILIFTLSSTQEFVASARRTQDAWAGSFIFSDLSWSSVKFLADQYGPDILVSPSLKEQAVCDYWLNQEMGMDVPQEDSALKVAAIPNMLTAIVPGEKLENVTSAIHAEIENRWEKLSSEVRNKLRNTIRIGLGDEIFPYEQDLVWKRQTKDFIPGLGFYWSAARLNDTDAILKILNQDFDPGSEKAQQLSYLKDLSERSKTKGTSYSLMSQAAGEALTARKNLRNFEQIEEPNYKCSLCGSREVWTGNALNQVVSYHDMRSFWSQIKSLDVEKRKGQAFKLAGRFRKGEMLCPVCITKRLALEGSSLSSMFDSEHLLFPSTAGIASMYFRRMLLKYVAEDQELASLADQYVHKIIDYLKRNNIFYFASKGPMGEFNTNDRMFQDKGNFHHLDGQWFYSESIESEDAVRRDAGLDSTAWLRGDLGQIRAAFSALKRHIEKQYKDNSELSMPSPYYAVIAMDGDNIGHWVVGKNSLPVSKLFHPELQDSIKDSYSLVRGNDELKNPMGPLFQLGLSECLKNYIKHKAQSVVEDRNCGKLIYAGGDDLVAFVPLPTLLSCMQDIYSEFGFGGDGLGNGWDLEKKCPLPGGRGGPDEDRSGMTISMGAVIAHYTTPLWDVMAQAQNVLKEKAKNGLCRNAFAFRILKRSGEISDVGCRFETSNGSVKTMLPMLQDIFQMMPATISSRIGNTLARQKWAFDFPAHDSSILPSAKELHNLQRTELLRLCKQHVKKKEETENTISSMSDLFDSILAVEQDIRAMRSKGACSPDLRFDPWKTMTDLLLALRFLSGRED